MLRQAIGQEKCPRVNGAEARFVPQIYDLPRSPNVIHYFKMNTDPLPPNVVDSLGQPPYVTGESLFLQRIFVVSTV